jgi:hypothetical protein
MNALLDSSFLIDLLNEISAAALALLAHGWHGIGEHG